VTVEGNDFLFIFFLLWQGTCKRFCCSWYCIRVSLWCLRVNV